MTISSSKTPSHSTNPTTSLTSSKRNQRNKRNKRNKRNERNKRNKRNQPDKLNKLSPLDSQILLTLKQICLAQRKHLWNQSLKHGLSPVQVQILLFLLHEGPEKSRVSLLAEEFGLSQASISETVGNLESKGYVFKQRSSNDRRVFSIGLTPLGLKLAKKLSFWPPSIRQKLSLFSEEEKEKALFFLSGFLEEVEKKTMGRNPNSSNYSNYSGHSEPVSSPKRPKVTSTGDRRD